jgi:hypothetical protein
MEFIEAVGIRDKEELSFRVKRGIFAIDLFYNAKILRLRFASLRMT